MGRGRRELGRHGEDRCSWRWASSGKTWGQPPSFCSTCCFQVYALGQASSWVRVENTAGEGPAFTESVVRQKPGEELSLCCNGAEQVGSVQTQGCNK